MHIQSKDKDAKSELKIKGKVQSVRRMPLETSDVERVNYQCSIYQAFIEYGRGVPFFIVNVSILLPLVLVLKIALGCG